MAADWIKVREDLPDDPAVMVMADHLGVTPEHVVGLLIRFWSWVGNHWPDGDASVTPVCASRHVRETHFHEAMIAAGWMEVRADGRFRVPKWERHNSENAKKRALAAERTKKWRDAGVTESSRKKRHKSVTREEKRREEISVSASALTDGEPPKRRLRTPRDDLFDAVRLTFAIDSRPKSAAARVGKIVTELTALEATPDELKIRTARYRTLHPDWECTPEALVKWWGSLDGTAQPAGRTQGPVGRARIAAPAGKYDRFNNPAPQRHPAADAGQAAQPPVNPEWRLG